MKLAPGSSQSGTFPSKRQYKIILKNNNYSTVTHLVWSWIQNVKIERVVGNNKGSSGWFSLGWGFHMPDGRKWKNVKEFHPKLESLCLSFHCHGDSDLFLRQWPQVTVICDLIAKSNMFTCTEHSVPNVKNYPHDWFFSEPHDFFQRRDYYTVLTL